MNGLNENVIDWITGDDEIELTLTQKKYITKVKKLAAELDPPLTYIENKDGSVYCRLPLRYLKITKPPTRELTEEQRQAAADRLRRVREGAK